MHQNLLVRFWLLKNFNISKHYLIANSPVKSSGKPSVQGDHRHRMTEKEEDEELMEQSKKTDTVFTFQKSPW